MKRTFFLFFLGTVVFALLHRFTPLGFFLSSLGGIASMIVVRFLFKITESSSKKFPGIEAKAQGNAARTVTSGIQKMREINNSARLIVNNIIADKIRDICKIGVAIFEHIEKNPQDESKARQFTNYYVDATKKIVEQYVELTGHKERTPEIEATLHNVEGMLQNIKETYKRQLAFLTEHDLLDLNAEITLMKKTMELEK